MAGNDRTLAAPAGTANRQSKKPHCDRVSTCIAIYMEPELFFDCQIIWLPKFVTTHEEEFPRVIKSQFF